MRSHHALVLLLTVVAYPAFGQESTMSTPGTIPPAIADSTGQPVDNMPLGQDPILTFPTQAAKTTGGASTWGDKLPPAEALPPPFLQIPPTKSN